jgi:gliding motility-associated-like protein
MYSVNVTTSGGCQLTASQQVDTLASPIITVKASPDHITVGETSQLTASGVQAYNWHPGTYLSDSTIANPVSTPTETIVYTVKGKGDNGCFGTTTLTVTVKGEDIVNLLKPSNFFSPNGDQVNNQWTIDNITNYPQCHVSIYDDKGVKVFDAKPYLNSWDGTYHGKPLPDGVYYYIIRCDGEESHPRTGSITILR